MSLSFEQFIEIAKLLGLVSAGGWTAWTFYRLQKIRAAELANNKLLIDLEKGRADVEKVRAEIEKSRVDVEKSKTDTEKARNDIDKSRIEQELMRDQIRSQQPQLSINLEVSEAGSPDLNYVSVLIVTVLLKNEGDQALWIGFNDHTLTLGRVQFGQSGKQLLRKKLLNVIHVAPMYFTAGSTSLIPFTERVLRAGQTRRMTLALVPIMSAGGYLVQFRAQYTRIDLSTYKGGGWDFLRQEEKDLSISAVEQRFYIATGKAEGLAPPSAAIQNS